jgi:hypothetical protein
MFCKNADDAIIKIINPSVLLIVIHDLNYIFINISLTHVHSVGIYEEALLLWRITLHILSPPEYEEAVSGMHSRGRNVECCLPQNWLYWSNVYHYYLVYCNQQQSN